MNNKKIGINSINRINKIGDNSNIGEEHVVKKGLQLNGRGSAKLAVNLIKKNKFSCKNGCGHDSY